jgi:hypothetical protein
MTEQLSLSLWSVEHLGVDGIGTGCSIVAAFDEVHVRMEVYQYLQRKRHGTRQLVNPERAKIERLEGPFHCSGNLGGEKIAIDASTKPGVKVEIWFNSPTGGDDGSIAYTDHVGEIVYLAGDNNLRERLLRANAHRQGLTLDNPPPDGGVLYHLFHLYYGDICVYPEAANVRRVVELARRYAECMGYGEHNALLAMRCLRDDLQLFRDREDEGRCLSWSSRYDLNNVAHPQSHVGEDHPDYISLADWLATSGQVPDIK